MRTLFQKLTRCPGCALAAFGLLFAVAIAAIFAADLRNRYHAAILGAEQNALSFAKVLAEHTARTFEAVDHTMREAEAIHQGRLSGLYPNSQSVKDALRHLQQSSPVLIAIGWTNAKGEFEANSLDLAPPLSEDELTRLKDNSSNGLLIGSRRLPTTGNWTTIVSRRINDASGHFIGAVTALLDPGYFSSTYRSIQLGKFAAVFLLHRDGQLIVREPPIAGTYSRNFATSPLLARELPKAESGTYRVIGTVDGIAHIAGYKAVPGLPLVVRVSYATEIALRPLYAHIRTFGPLVVILVVTILLGTALLVQQNRKLAKKSNLFEVTMKNISQGLCMFDDMQRLVMCNERYATMYGLTSEETKPGTTLLEVLEARVRQGNSPINSQSYINNRLEEARSEHAHVVINELRDGRVVSVYHHPIDGGSIAVHQDITEQRRIEAEVARLAHYDALTGLANRALFTERLVEALACLERGGEKFSILMLDLDQFKEVNDSLGHPIGDALLKLVAQRLLVATGPNDLVARLGGDEFAILQRSESAQKDDAIVLANRILQALTDPYVLDGFKVMIGTSIGIALAPDHGLSPDHLLRNADFALYRTKAQGRNGYRFFEPWMEEEAHSRRALGSDLRSAIARSEFELYYQTVVDIHNREICSIEALIRWHHRERGLVGPDQFIPLAEETGLIVPMGEWILQRACMDAATWPSPIKVAVNLSPAQFGRGDLLDVVTHALAQSGLQPERLELEVTESILLRNNGENIATLNKLKSLGASIVLDDFGTGYSSLSYLQMFPFDKLKIDKSFVSELANRAECAAIVCAIVGLGRSLGIGTTAEGVETSEQLELLRAAGCRQVQGYLLSRPMPASNLTFESPNGLQQAQQA